MNKKHIVFACAALGLIAGILTACDHFGTIRNTVGGLTYSIEVNNQRSRAAIGETDTVELYIHNFEYMEDANNRCLILIADGDRDQGSKGGILNNAGWYSVNADLAVTNDVNNGPYSSFLVSISRIRVAGVEYYFPYGSVVFGKPSQIWQRQGLSSSYPDNFTGITVNNNTRSIKTVITVEPDILGTGGGYTNGLANDPYQYIKVEGRINE